MQTWTGQWRPGAGWTAPLPAWDGPATLVTGFGPASWGNQPGPLTELAATYPQSVIIGCSTSGEILGETLDDGTLTVSVTRFTTTRLHLASAQVGQLSDSRAAGAQVAQALISADPDVQAIFVLSDGLNVNGSELTLGLSQVCAGRALVTGGLAGDGNRFEQTWVLVDGIPQTGVVTAVGLAGPDLMIGNGTGGGWDILGPERRITRSQGSVLFELDGQPALDLYHAYLGERAQGLPATALLFPLGIRVPGAQERQVVRTVLGIDERTRSITFAGDVPADSLAQLMRGNVERIVDAAASAARAIRAESGGPMLVLAISCVGRRLLLGQRTEDELEAVVDGLPDSASVVGFYSYGEISPADADVCDLHNQTMTITAIQERVRV